jgi:lipoyl(octanoyl) transferase
MEWKLSQTPVEYPEAIAFMEERVAGIRHGQASECVWLLEHPPLYTAGTSANEADLLTSRFPVYQTGRGGQYTYHGPGQRVAYVMADLKRFQAEPDLKKYIHNLEEWVIGALSSLGVQGERRDGRVGIWVDRNGRDYKIAAIGVRVRHWITYHGVSVNVNPDLSHFTGIVPCGIREHGVTSLQDLGLTATMGDLDEALRKKWDSVF